VETAVIGLDIGTSSIKGMVYNPEKGVICFDRLEFSRGVSDIKTIDPDGVFCLTIELLSKLTRKAEGLKINAVGLGTIFPSLILLDKDGKALARAFTWADNSAAGIVEDFKRDEEQALALYRKTGCALDGSYPLWKIIWLKEQKRDLFLRADRFVSLAEYIVYRFTGKFLVSEAIASTTGLFNIHTLDWDDSILGMAGINRNMLSECRSLYHAEKILGDICLQIGVDTDTYISPGAGDGLLCHLGSGCNREGMMSSTLGTSGALRILVDEPILTDPAVWCYCLDDKIRISGSAINTGLGLLRWPLNESAQTSNGYLLKELDEYIRMRPVDGPVFFSSFQGKRGTDYTRDIKASFAGSGSKDEALVTTRAVLEAIFFNMYSCYRGIEDELGAPSEIRASGGYADFDSILQMQADIFNKKICVPVIKEAGALGAAWLALRSTGELSDVLQLEAAIEKIFYPDANRHREYMSRYGVYGDMHANAVEAGS